MDVLTGHAIEASPQAPDVTGISSGAPGDAVAHVPVAGVILSAGARPGVAVTPGRPLTPDEVCECGVPLRGHPRLTKPRPLTSWHAERHSERGGSVPCLYREGADA